ncbi:MAG: hypothetical protein CMM47_04610 [Rhodospirillaceae bacterium]|nr:hypothetical protein [Rhodospirillaceae bacterium]
MSNQARSRWLDKLQPLKGRLLQRYSADRIEDAVRWRLGKFYYSAVREVDLLISINAAGIPLKYHLVADVLLRVDYWVDQNWVHRES